MKLRLYGMELPFGCYKKGWKVRPHPLYAETYWKWGADLVLSGHLHGGIAETSTAWRCDQSAVPPVPTLQRGLL